MDTGGKLGPVQHEAAPLRNKIILSLRRAVETGLLEPGARLVEKDLCQQLNVSRTSLREALRQLQAEGVLANAGNRGLAVARVSMEDAVNIYRLRSVIETLIVEQFVENASERRIVELQAAGEHLKKMYRLGVVDEIVAAKRAFYDCLSEGAGNPIALDLLTKLTLLTSTLRRRSLARPQRQRQSLGEIDALLDAIARRDGPAAKAAIGLHVENLSKSALYDSSGEPLSPLSSARAKRSKVAAEEV